MPQTPHVERHFTASETVRDVVIGMSDGLTVPFALAAGLSGAAIATRIIVTAGLAEIAAGSIAMGLGGYLAARSDAEHYANERRREEREVVEKAGRRAHGGGRASSATTASPMARPSRGRRCPRRPTRAWVDFMMRFELGLEKPDPKRALTSALTIAGAYIAGGLIPLESLHRARQRADGAGRLGDRDAARALPLRRRQGALHGRAHGAQRLPDDADRRPRRDRRLRHRAPDRVTRFATVLSCPAPNRDASATPPGVP